MLVPSAEFVAQLPNRKIPDRKDFTELSSQQRIRDWETTLTRTEQLAESLHEQLNKGNIVDTIRPLAF